MSPRRLMFATLLAAALAPTELFGSLSDVLNPKLAAATQEASSISGSAELPGTLVSVDGDTATYVLPWSNKSEPPIVEVRIREKATSDTAATRMNHQAWEGVVSIDCRKQLFMRPNGGLFYYSDGRTGFVSEGPIGPRWMSVREAKLRAIRLIARQVCKSHA